MSITTSAANLDPPRLLFGQRSPSPHATSTPSSSSFRQASRSPTPSHSQHSQHPVAAAISASASAPAPAAGPDIDMSTSTTFHPSNGQNHDRNEEATDDWLTDSDISDSENETTLRRMSRPPEGREASAAPQGNGEAVAATTAPTANGNSNSNTAAADEDAMDTSPDNVAEQAESSHTDPQTQQPPTPNTSGGSATQNADSTQPPTNAPSEPAPVTSQANTESQEAGSNVPVPEVADIQQPPSQTTENNPGAQPQTANPQSRDLSPDPEESDEDDEMSNCWREIVEDTSEPSAEELKTMELGQEPNALEHAYWEKKTFTPLEEPEYQPGPSGRIDWLIEHYNGTKENPNRELVMKSEPIEVGGYTWQLKFYPKGNESEYLSVYVECLSVAVDKEKLSSRVRRRKKDRKHKRADEKKDRQEAKEAKDAEDQRMVDAGASNEATPVERQHAPLPLLDVGPLPKRRSVAAQVSVVLYNPTEPRVNYHRSCLHRFCAGSPDWGWTRFHGPHYEIQYRHRGKRMALLRNDKLAFKCYIRVVEDSTGCLWEHVNQNNPWDCFAMTGLQGLVPPDIQSNHGGNLISAVSSWMNLRPFRELLYDTQAQSRMFEHHQRPQPLLTAFQKALYSMRTQVMPLAGCIGLDPIIEVLDWYGIDIDISKMDVVELWVLLRTKLQQELADTPYENRLTELFGPPRSRTLNPPRYRVPVRNSKSIQGALSRAPLEFPAVKALPKILSVELERQEFSDKAKNWRKVTEKVKLDEKVVYRDLRTSYTLFGFIVHNEGLQSNRYYSVLRPDGPGGKWFQYSDGREDKKVKCLTHNQALVKHEGSDSATAAMAYIVLYIRDDVAKTAFTNTPEPEWKVPQWLVDDVKRDRDLSDSASNASEYDISHVVNQQADKLGVTKKGITTSDQCQREKKDAETGLASFQVFDSRVFSVVDGPGLIDPFYKGFSESKFVHTVRVSKTATVSQLREAVANALGPDTVQDIRQVRLWIMDSLEGHVGRPRLWAMGGTPWDHGSRFVSAAEIEQTYDERMLWVHIVPVADLPPVAVVKPQPELQPEQTFDSISVSQPASTSEAAAPQTGDRTLDGADNATAENGEGTVAGDVAGAPANTSGLTAHEDTVMSDVDDEGGDAADESDNTAPGIPPPPLPLNAEWHFGRVPTSNVGSSAEAALPAPPPPPPPSVPVPLNVFLDTEMGGVSTNRTALVPGVAPMNGSATTSGVPPLQPPQAPNPAGELYIFVKRFDTATQNLVSRASVVVKRQDYVLPAVRSALNISSEASVPLFCEHSNLTATQLRVTPNTRFSDCDINNTDIIIARFPDPLALKESSSSSSSVTTLDPAACRLAVAGRHSDPNSLLRAWATARNSSLASYTIAESASHKWPARAAITHEDRSYFSSERYTGEVAGPLGLAHGAGRMTYHSGDQYLGGFALGARHGTGRMAYANGDSYDGDWMSDTRHGQGTFREQATGNTYVGGWKADRRHGEGVTHWRVAQESSRMCRVCWEEEAATAFYDCGHVVACMGCAKRVDTCPVCRRRIVSAMKLYYVS